MDYCAYRSETNLTNDTCKCSNKKIRVGDGIIPLTMCVHCPWQNRQVDPELLRTTGTPEITVSTPEQTGPTVIQMGVNFSKAMLRQAGAALKGEERFVSTEEYQARLKVCSTCEMQKDGRCLLKSCGCFLSRKAKLSTETCNIGKWDNLSVSGVL